MDLYLNFQLGDGVGNLVHEVALVARYRGEQVADPLAELDEELEADEDRSCSGRGIRFAGRRWTFISTSSSATGLA